MERKINYSNGELTVVWKPNLCIHAAECVKGLPNVFKPKEKPWVKIDQANTQEIANQVKKCPSGALSYFMNDTEEEILSQKNMPETIAVNILTDGPLIVKGDIEVTHNDGSKELKSKQVAFCRCGASDNKPYCDGSHKKVAFTG